MKNGVKFHSIFYRFILFIFVVFLTVISMILDAKKAQIRFFNLSLTIGQEELKVVTVAVLLLTFLLSFLFKWKCLIHKTGIYLRKIDLFIAWDEIRGFSHVWINEYHRGPHGFRSIIVRRWLFIEKIINRFAFIIFQYWPYMWLNVIIQN